MELSRNLIEQLVREVIAEAQSGNGGREARQADPAGSCLCGFGDIRPVEASISA